jgi:hypothetical protein
VPRERCQTGRALLRWAITGKLPVIGYVTVPDTAPLPSQAQLARVLIGQLSNPDIQKQLSRLCRDLEQAMVGNGSVVRERHACRCGCEREVAQPRKFVDQAH